MNKSEAGKLGWLASRKTHLGGFKKRVVEYLKNPKLCKNCDSIIPYKKKENKFCNHKCSATFHNQRRKINRPCKNCGKILDLSTGWKKIYCDKKCQSAFGKNKRIKDVLSSGVFASNASVKTIKSTLIEIRGIQCEVCLITEWCDQPVPLVMDHINGNSGDNRLMNLRLVCGNCDMQLPTYKGKNKGNGRAYRRQRYKEGKSY